MKVFGKPGLVSLIYTVLAFIAFVTDEDAMAYVMFSAAVLLLGVSYICEAIEKAGKPSE